MRSLHKDLGAGALKPHHHHHDHDHDHDADLAQRAGAGLAQGKVVKLVAGDQAVHKLPPDYHQHQHQHDAECHRLIN